MVLTQNLARENQVWMSGPFVGPTQTPPPPINKAWCRKTTKWNRSVFWGRMVPAGVIADKIWLWILHHCHEHQHIALPQYACNI